MTSEHSRLELLRSAFNAELEERERALNQYLLRLERGGLADQSRAELFDALFREAHSLKGAARAVELQEVERLAHALESSLEGARRGARTLDSAWFDAAYRAVDAFKALNQAALDGEGATLDVGEIIHELGVSGTASGEPVPPSGPSHAAPIPGPQPTLANGGASHLPGGPSAHNSVVSRPSHPREELPSDPSASGPDSVARAGVESVRVAVDKLDSLLAQVGELAVTHIRIEERLRELGALRQDVSAWQREWRAARALRISLLRHAGRADPAGQQQRDAEALAGFAERAEARVQAVLEQLDRAVADLRNDTLQLGLVTHTLEQEVMAVRLLPARTIFSPFERMVRDLARQQSKEAEISFLGGDIEVDRKILEQLRDPLMHMLRNAVDHGLESPEERVASGKPRQGTISISVSQRAGTVELELADDGRGLDPERLRESAIRKGLVSEDAARVMDDQTSMELIFLPGFTTRASVTETSGRGVGMDVVREHVERLQGQVGVRSIPGRGTWFTITAPLTLATTRAILVGQDDQVFAVPSAAVERNSRLRPSALVSVESCQAVLIDGQAVPVVRLADVLERGNSQPAGRHAPEWQPFFVLRQGERSLALLVDRFVGEQEIVVKSLGWPLLRVRNVGGAAVLGAGQMVIILNPFDLFKSGMRLVSGQSSRVASPPMAEAVPQRRSRVLVVDDSLTTRTLERSILEAAGYDVAVATDGVDALGLLRRGGIDLVVSDIEMPRMDGFSLTAEIRREDRLKNTPVVLVTSLDAAEHRERGVQVGADAYIVKGAFDQGQLLDTVGRLL